MNVQHLEVFSGTNATLSLSARDAANAPANLTDKTIAWYVGRSPWRPDNGTAIFTKAGTIVSASGGTFTVAVVPEDTQWMNGDYEHMALTTDDDDNVEVVTQGRFRIRASLTPGS